MILAIVGSRNFKNFDLLENCVNQIKEEHDISKIVSGGARGADTLAEKYAEKYNIPLIVYKADWNKHGKAAGPMRNTLIVNNCDLLIAFPDSQSRGTWDSVKKAKAANKKVFVFNV